MLEFKTILFPVDLYAVSPKLVNFVIGMVQKFSSELHVLYVVRTFEPSFEADYIPYASYERSLMEIKMGMENKLRDFITENFSGLPSVKSSISSGHTAREIISYIESNNISLVVMGTHGHRGLEKVFFGSVAQRVVEASPVPVLTLNPFL